MTHLSLVALSWRGLWRNRYGHALRCSPTWELHLWLPFSRWQRSKTGFTRQHGAPTTPTVASQRHAAVYLWPHPPNQHDSGSRRSLLAKTLSLLSPCAYPNAPPGLHKHQTMLLKYLTPVHLCNLPGPWLPGATWTKSRAEGNSKAPQKEAFILPGAGASI